MKLTEEQIEELRRSGLRLDRQGRFWHDGEVVRHPGLQRALLRWLDVLPDSRAILRLDETRYAYVEVEDAFLLVTSAQWRDDRLFLTTNDEGCEELDYSTLESSQDNSLYCRVRASKLLARFTTPAYYTLTERLVELGDGFAVRAAGGLHPIATP